MNKLIKNYYRKNVDIKLSLIFQFFNFYFAKIFFQLIILALSVSMAFLVKRAKIAR